MSSILIVDDDTDLRESLREVLCAESYEVTTAKNGQDALKLVQERDYDLILLDFVMPGLSGLDTLLLLKQSKPQILVVLVTAFSTVENAVEAMRRGAQDYLTKPFNTSTLLTTVRRVLAEAQFKVCKAVLDLDDAFNSLANPIRRQILELLSAKGKIRFMELTRELGIEDHTKVNFHLKVLKENGLISQEDKKFYQLSAEGEKVVQCMNVVVSNLSSY